LSDVRKSQSIKELANSKFVIHLCLCKKGDGFFLYSFEVADLILKELVTIYPCYKALSHFVAYICACYEELVEFLDEVKSEEMKSKLNSISIFHIWYHQQITTYVTGNIRLGGKTFWRHIFNRILTIQNEFLSSIESISDSEFAKRLKTKIRGTIEELEKQLKMFHCLREGDVSIIFAINEAQLLMVPNKGLGNNSLYHYFCVASSTIPGYDPDVK
ncbi:9402_t:CDS:1, partial [Acaulospora morrowiae]